MWLIVVSASTTQPVKFPLSCMYQNSWRKQAIQVLGAAGANLPSTLDDVDVLEVGTPLSFAHYLRSESGAVYGLDHDLNRFEPRNFYLRLRPYVPEVPGLYLTGQDMVADSLVGAMSGGLLCAQKVLGVVDPMTLIRRVPSQSDEGQDKDDVTPFHSLVITP